MLQSARVQRPLSTSTHVVLLIIRIIVGLLFIFSGLVKANDPLGLSYKMQEFFEVWNLHSLNDYTLFLSVVMNTFEIVAGVAVLLGWRMNLFSWLLLLLIIFFTFLTGYAVFSGKIKTCGCFGDCIPLSPVQSFVKDLVLLALIAVIFFFRHRFKPILSSGTCGLVILASVLCCIILQWYVLKHLPIVDCLPYKVGNNISEQMKIPEGAVPDSFSIQFKYLKDGKEVLFDMEHFPEDFNDSAYQFVERTQQLVRAGNAIAPITDFSLRSLAGNDSTEAILQQPGLYVMMFLKDLSSAKVGWHKDVPAVVQACKKNNIPFYVVSAVADLAKERLSAVDGITFLRSDATVIKTAARENPTYIIMKQATIKGKYAAADSEEAIEHINQLK